MHEEEKRFSSDSNNQKGGKPFSLFNLSLPFVTQRLLIREFNEKIDASPMYEIARNESYYRFLNIDLPTPQNVADFVSSAAKDKDAFGLRKNYDLAVILKEKNQLIGGISLRIISESNKEGEIGYALAPQFHGQGLMSEAAKMLLLKAFSEVGLYRVRATCDIKNIASSRVMEKIGLKREGIMRGFMQIRGERREASYLYAAIREDFGF